MFDSELLKRLHYLSLVAGRAGRVSLVAAGQSTPSGGGEVGALRDYVPGDDYRHVDWVRCARHDDLLTRTFEPFDDAHVYILLDCSPSMGIGSPAKFEVARQIAAALGYLALEGLARLSVVAFAGTVVAELPPIRHKTRAAKLLGFLRQLKVQSGQTDLRRTAELFAARYQRHGPVVILSDLYDPAGFGPGLDVLRHRGYEPRLVQIHAPDEARAELLGDLELFDVETETTRRVTVTQRVARRYRQVFVEFQESVRRYCRRHGLAWLQIASDMPEEEVLLQVVGGTARGRAGRERESFCG